MKKKIEKGSASIKIDLDNGNITVYHGEDEDVLHKIINAEDGSWDKIWELLRSIKSV